MTDNVLTSLPATEPDRWRLLTLQRFDDERGAHLRLGFDCELSSRSWRARWRRALLGLGLRRAAERLPMRAHVGIELFAIQPTRGEIIERDGDPRPGLFDDGPRRVVDLVLEMTQGQGVQYYLLKLITEAGEAEVPSFDAIVRWRLIRNP